MEGVWDRRTAKDAQDVVWDRSKNLTEKESLLKPKSLRNIEVRVILVVDFHVDRNYFLEWPLDSCQFGSSRSYWG